MKVLRLLVLLLPGICWASSQAPDGPTSPTVLDSSAPGVVTFADRESFEVMKQWSVEGAIEGLYEMGRLHWYGAPELGMLEDVKKAVGMLERAARGGHGAAATLLGDLQWAGNRVMQDPDSAIRWYELGAKNGDSISALRLARIYEQGIGVNKDIALSLRYYTVAANSRANPSPEAQSVLGYRYLTGTGGVVQSLEKAQTYLTKAADGGDSAAQLNLALSILQGNIVGRSPKDGIDYLVASAKQGRARAKYVLSTLYYNGQFVSKNLTLADQLAQQAYAGGIKDAMAVMNAISKSGVVPAQAGPTVPPASASIAGTAVKVHGGAASITKLPDAKAKVIDTAVEDEELVIMDTKGDWSLVKRKNGAPFKSGDAEGWVLLPLTVRGGQ